MAKKSGNFFEQNIDKIVLAVMGIICLAIVAMMVVRSPNSIVLDGKSYGPGEIDPAISYKVADLETKLAAPAQPRSYASRFNEFKSIYAAAVNVPQDSQLPLPASPPEKPRQYEGPYSEPAIQRPAKLIAGLISGVAAVPLGSSPEMGAEPGDVDLVTIQSSFNANAVYAFMADAFKDSELKTPVFAAVELQRQEMNEDGTWPGDAWQTIKRTKVDPYGDILDIEKLKSMPVSEAEALRTHLAADPVAIDVLQPIPYGFQSRTTPWLPPEFEDKRLKDDARREMLGGASGEGMPSSTTAARPAPGRTGAATTSGEGDGRTTTRTTTRLPQQPSRTPPATTRQPTGTGVPGRPGMMPGGETAAGMSGTGFEGVTITNPNLLGTMQQVVFWSHDDTTEPGKTYRYRLRLGVLNPIAGRGRSTTDPTLSQKLIFWSEFTGDLSAKEPYPVVDVPARMYLFPSKLRESDNMVTVEVAKYSMARWEKKQYEVKPGETIGRLEKMAPVMDSAGNYVTLPDVDFSTGITMLDVKSVTENRPNSPNPVTYYQMLYKDSDDTIRQVPIKGSFWSKLLRKRYSEIDTAIRNQPLVPVSYVSTSGPGPAYSPTTPTMPMSPGGSREE